MIKVSGLSKAYGSRNIVKNWNYQFENGKIYGLIGRNGIGKTTVMKCISGLCTPDGANIFTEQGNVSPLDYLDRKIYYVSDEPVFYNDLTLSEHLWLVCRVEGYVRKEAGDKILHYVSRLRMEEYMHDYPPALSKGTLQRMMLIMGFLRKTPNLLLDEPFNGLDPVQLQETIKICDEEREGRCLLVSSHDIESLGELCDEYLIFTAKGIETISGTIDREKVNHMIGESYA